MICAGIDAGSRTIKIVLIDADSLQVLAKALTDQGIEQNKLTAELFKRLLRKNHINRKNIRKIVATGYGRNRISIADATVTEITCQAVAIRHLIPNAITVIDIGGQDSKLVRLEKTGKVRDFVMNDRCAAGTGRFLEIIAERLEISLKSFGNIAAASRRPAIISSMCAVFAETEIVGLLAAGTTKQDIAAGVQAAIASRIAAMTAGKVDLPIIFTGGVALVPGMDTALKFAFKQNIIVSPYPQMTAAIGAAIIASDRFGGAAQ